MSTYQAVAGPLDNALATPLITPVTRNIQSVVDTARRISAARVNTAEAASSTRRPSTSARPPVGSSRPMVTSENTVTHRPI